MSTSDVPIIETRARERALERDADLPAPRRRGLEERVRAGRADRRRIGRADEQSRPAVEDGLRRAQREHDVGLEERGVDAYVAQAVAVHRHELRRLGVVNLDRAAKPARELGRNELVDVTTRACGARALRRRGWSCPRI